MSDILTTPDRMGMGYERVSIPVGEGSERKELDGFWVPAEGPDPPTFLYFTCHSIGMESQDDVGSSSLVFAFVNF